MLYMHFTYQDYTEEWCCMLQYILASLHFGLLPPLPHSQNVTSPSDWLQNELQNLTNTLLTQKYNWRCKHNICLLF